jgi:putative ABC transport system permease protein
MIELASLALRSLWNRRGTAALTVFSIAVSVALLLGVQKLRDGAQESFAGTISGTDLIVGARGSQVGLLLYSVFRIGDPTTNVSWDTYQKVARHPDVAWTVPLALGDSHRGYRVIGTTASYFEHYRYARTRSLKFAEGRPFAETGVVLGSEVARSLGYRPGDEIVVSHGIGEGSFAHHDAHPLQVSGVLARTGTPVDRALHVSLGTLAAIHGSSVAAGSLSAFLVGMRARETSLLMQRALNEYRGEAVQAVIPGMALAELWRMLGPADRALTAISACVVLAGLLGMLSAIMTTLNERRREMAILRSVGARPSQVFLLLVLEAGTLAAAGALCGIALAYGALALAQPLLEQRLGLLVPLQGLATLDLLVMASVVGAALLLGSLPAWRAYRNSLADGLAIRI